LYETLSMALGKSLEPHLNNVMDNVLQSFADSKEEVRVAAKRTMKVIMGQLSGFAVKQLLPVFI